MKTRTDIINDNPPEVIVSPWQQNDLSEVLRMANTSGMTDADYRSVHMPRKSFAEMEAA